MKLPKLISTLSGLGLGALSATYIWYAIQSAALDYLGRESKRLEMNFPMILPERSIGEIFADIESGNDAQQLGAWSQLSDPPLISSLTDEEEAKVAALCASTLRRPRRLSEIRFSLSGSDILSFWRQDTSRKLCLDFVEGRSIPLPLRDDEIAAILESSNPTVQVALMAALVVTPERPISCDVAERLASDNRENSITRIAQKILADSPQCLNNILRVLKVKAEDVQLRYLLGRGALGVTNLLPDFSYAGLDVPEYSENLLARWRCTSPAACDKVLDAITDEKSKLKLSCFLQHFLSSSRKKEMLKEIERYSANVDDVPTVCLPLMPFGDDKVFEQQIEKLLINKSYERQGKAIEVLGRNVGRIESSPTLQRLLGAHIGQMAGPGGETSRILKLLVPATATRINQIAQEKFSSTCEGEACTLARFETANAESFETTPANPWDKDLPRIQGIIREAVLRENTKVERLAADDFLQIALMRRTKEVATAFVNLALELKHVPKGTSSILKMLDLEGVSNLEQLLHLPLSRTDEILIRKQIGMRADAKLAADFKSELNSQYPTRRLMALYGLRCTPWEEFRLVLDRALDDKSSIVQTGAAYLGFRRAPNQAALRGLLVEKRFHSISGQSLQALARRYDYEPSILIPLASTLLSGDITPISSEDTSCK